MKPFRVLTLGDVVGAPGLAACLEMIPHLKEEEQIDFVIANGENLADGSGITESTVSELFRAGADIVTSGDHVFRKKDAEKLLRENPCILRPANYPSDAPGRGSVIMETKEGIKVGVLNLIGRVFLKAAESPFETALEHIEMMKKETPVLFVDIHAEATSEKVALGWFLDGKVSAVFGTHTHIQTADEQILPEGTGYITELGMCGPYRSVIGRSIRNSLQMFLTQLPVKLEVAEDDARISGAIFEVDPETGKTIAVRRIHEKVTHEVR